MRAIFVDTSGFVVFLNPHDEDHSLANDYLIKRRERIVTTAWVLTELGNFLSATANRQRFVSFYRDLRADSHVSIIAPDTSLFERGMELFAKRTDKEWSVTDCISFIVMKHRRLIDALTADHHFEQAGFNALLKS
ncbi:MAG: type II toxin-antitoxin system VapC family toxin [Planctomycetia bacterium]|nr:type II toxin-antitoxin system VapC family toxin [Planctomycetia bacterium]